jgi:hypothetical protein
LLSWVVCRVFKVSLAVLDHARNELLRKITVEGGGETVPDILVQRVKPKGMTFGWVIWGV